MSEISSCSQSPRYPLSPCGLSNGGETATFLPAPPQNPVSATQNPRDTAPILPGSNQDLVASVSSLPPPTQVRPESSPFGFQQEQIRAAAAPVLGHTSQVRPGSARRLPPYGQSPLHSTALPGVSVPVRRASPCRRWQTGSIAARFFSFELCKARACEFPR